MKQLELQLIEINKRLDVLTDAVNTGGGGIIDPCCPATNTLLGEIKTIIQEVEVSINETHDTFQILDCAGLPIGTPQDVEKTVVLNKLTSQICNVQELADAIVASLPESPTVTNYDNEEELVIPTNATYTISANSVHAYSITVKGSGTASTIKIGTDSPSSIDDGYSKSVEFSTTNIKSVEIFCDVDDVIRVIKQF